MFTGTTGTDYQDTTITNDGFWPDLNVGEFERRRGVPVVQDSERIAFALANSVSEVNQQLETLKAKYIAQGVQKAADIQAFPNVNNKNRIVVQYEAAVMARAKADLLPDFATVSQKQVGDHLAERSEETKNELLAESQRIVRSMHGKTRCGVALL